MGFLFPALEYIMKLKLSNFLALAVVSALVATMPAHAAEEGVTIQMGAFERAAAKRATDLLDRAVVTLQKSRP